MNSDATEAALGLLGLSPLNASQPHPQLNPRAHHLQALDPDSGILGPAERKTTQNHLFSSLVPLKRKQSSAEPTPILPSTVATTTGPCGRPVQTHSASSPLSLAKPALPLLPQISEPQSSHSPLVSSSPHPTPSPTISHPPFATSPFTAKLPSNPHPKPLSRRASSRPTPHQAQLDPPPSDTDDIFCICGFTYDDGFSIACDDCSRWCHAACFGIVEGGDVPEEWRCWQCEGRSISDEERERAVKLQKKRLKTMRMKNGTSCGNGHGNAMLTSEEQQQRKPASRRKPSPGMEKKSRKANMAAATTEVSSLTTAKKRRRTSIMAPADPSSSGQRSSSGDAMGQNTNSTAKCRISQPLRSTSNVADLFPSDTYSHPSVHTRLLKVARAWRGVTALSPPVPLVPPDTYVDRGYVRVDSQGYKDRYGYSMSPIDTTTPVIVNDHVEMALPSTVLKTGSRDGPSAPFHSSLSHTPSHLLRPPSPRLHVGPPSNFSSNDIAVPSNTLLAPYTAHLLSSSAYLADPLNGYAHLGMGKPQVRLVGGGWCVGLDARDLSGGARTDRKQPTKSNDEKENRSRNGSSGAADASNYLEKAKWARCGCWPNAVVRPIICGGKRRVNRKGTRSNGCATQHKEMGKHHHSKCAQNLPSTNESESLSDDEDTDVSDSDSTTLSFALFALQDLRADEEIVLGWEWDDGHAVHRLPALIESPGMFGPAHFDHLRAQYTSVLHALSSTFTTCACGSSTRDCAVRVMESVAEGRWPWPDGSWPGADCRSSSDEEGTPAVDLKAVAQDPIQRNVTGDQSRTDRKRCKAQGVEKRRKRPLDLGPLVGAKRGFRTHERSPMSGGWCGVEVDPSSLAWPRDALDQDMDVDASDKCGGKRGLYEEKKSKTSLTDPGHSTTMENDMAIDSPEDPPRSVDMLPPRMRKLWAQQSASSWTSHNVSVESPMSATDDGPGHSYGPGGLGMNGQETDFDTETEGEDTTNDTRQMPPPPMPASLDPTTVSSLTHAHTYTGRYSPRVLLGSPHIPARSMLSPIASTPIQSEQVTLPATQSEAISPLQSSPPPTPSDQQSLSRPPHSPSPTQLHSSLSPSVPFSRLSLFSPGAVSSAIPLSSVPDAPTPGPGRQCGTQLQVLTTFPVHPNPSADPSQGDSAKDTPVNGCQLASTQAHSAMGTPPSDAKLAVQAGLQHVHLRSQEILTSPPTLRTKNRSHTHGGIPQTVGGKGGRSGLGIQTSTIQQESDAMSVDNDAVGDTPDRPHVTLGAASGEVEVVTPRHKDTPSRSFEEQSPCAHSQPHALTSSELCFAESPLLGSKDPACDMLDSPQVEPTLPSQVEPQPPVTPTLHQSELEPQPSQPARIPSPPLPKVKMSLKDFALRRKKQREEEQAAKSTLSPNSPASGSPQRNSGGDERTTLVHGGDSNAIEVVERDDCDESKPPASVTNIHNKNDCQEIPSTASPNLVSKERKVHVNGHGTTPSFGDSCQHYDPPEYLPSSKALEATKIPPKDRYLSPSQNLVTKIESAEELLVSESYPHDHAHGVVTFAPDPPPPPLHEIGTSLADNCPTFRASPPPASTSASTSAHANPPPRTYPFSTSTDSRRHSHEDGEIPSPTSSKTYVPRLHTPPTQPRSFQASRPPSPGGSDPPATSLAARRPPHLPPSRPVPSGPRALRGTINQPSCAPTQSRAYPGSRYTPRGPSAARERDWDRDRSWTAPSRSRGRAGSNGWGR